MTSVDVCLKIQSKKKVKSVYFAPGEIDLLLTLYEQNKDKLRSSKTSPEVKGMIWDRMAEQLSMLDVCRRTGINVKHKWDNLQRHGKMEEALMKAHKKGTGGGEELPLKEKKEEALYQRVMDLCSDDLSFCGITGGYETKICLGPAPTKSELLNVNIVSSGSSDEVDDVKSKLLIERNEMQSTPLIVPGCSSANTCMNIVSIKESEQVNKNQCSSSQSSKKRKSISEAPRCTT